MDSRSIGPYILFFWNFYSLPVHGSESRSVPTGPHKSRYTTSLCVRLIADSHRLFQQSVFESGDLALAAAYPLRLLPPRTNHVRVHRSREPNVRSAS